MSNGSHHVSTSTPSPYRKKSNLLYPALQSPTWFGPWRSALSTSTFGLFLWWTGCYFSHKHPLQKTDDPQGHIQMTMGWSCLYKWEVALLSIYSWKEWIRSNSPKPKPTFFIMVRGGKISKLETGWRLKQDAHVLSQGLAGTPCDVSTKDYGLL